VLAGSAEVALRAVPHPATVLAVGCGTGALLRVLADRLPAHVASFDAEGRTILVVALDIAEYQVQTVRAISNPDKLRHLYRTADRR
jgi:2-polyprenyl-3-methyl-5-hydroxy-6-metoxy-1,4-benzoquinol methylase